MLEILWLVNVVTVIHVALAAHVMDVVRWIDKNLLEIIFSSMLILKIVVLIEVSRLSVLFKGYPLPTHSIRGPPLIWLHTRHRYPITSPFGTISPLS